MKHQDYLTYMFCDVIRQIARDERVELAEVIAALDDTKSDAPDILAQMDLKREDDGA